MKNNIIENIPKSLGKEEKLEQKSNTTHLINQNEENQIQNNQDLKKEEILLSKNSFFPLKNNDSKKDIETNEEFNFDFFKDNDDLFNSTADSHSINITNNEFNQDLDRKKIKVSNSFLMNNKNSCLQLNNDKSDLINDNFCSFNNKTFILPFQYKNNDFKNKNGFNQNFNEINIQNFNNFSVPVYFNNINIFFNEGDNYIVNNKSQNSSNNMNISQKQNNKKIANPYHLQIYLNDLENLLKKENSIDLNIFKTIKKDFPYLIKTQNGSKILQKYLQTTSNQVIHFIFTELIDKLILLLQDQNASSFCLKLFCCLDLNDRFNYLNLITNNIIQLSMNKIATYGIQFIIEKLYSSNEKLMILRPIKMNLLKLALDIYGTHVIEKILMTFEFEYSIDIYNFIIENLIFLANHVNGLCLVKQTLVLQNQKEYYQIIKKTLIERSYELIENPYGNYALQIVIDHWNHDDIIEIFRKFFGNCTELSVLKYSSNVIEKCLMKSEIFLNYFIQETCIEKKSIGILIKNAFGNYVIQTALKSCKGKAKMILINSIENNLGILGDKKLINKWKNIISLNIQNVNNSNNVNDYYIFNKNYNYRSDIKSNNVNVNKEI